MTKDTERRILRGLESAAEQGRAVLFPECRDFSELVARCAPAGDLSTYRSRHVHEWKVGELLPGGRVRPTGRAHFSSFCAVSDGSHRHLDVVPSDAVLAAVEERMLLSDQYVINMEVTVRDDGTALVSARYNLISGSRWLAIVPASTIPGRGPSNATGGSRKRAAHRCSVCRRGGHNARTCRERGRPRA